MWLCFRQRLLDTGLVPNDSVLDGSTSDDQSAQPRQRPASSNPIDKFSRPHDQGSAYDQNHNHDPANAHSSMATQCPTLWGLVTGKGESFLGGSNNVSTDKNRTSGGSTNADVSIVSDRTVVANSSEPGSSCGLMAVSSAVDHLTSSGSKSREFSQNSSLPNSLGIHLNKGPLASAYGDNQVYESYTNNPTPSGRNFAGLPEGHPLHTNTGSRQVTSQAARNVLGNYDKDFPRKYGNKTSQEAYYNPNNTLAENTALASYNTYKPTVAIGSYQKDFPEPSSAVGNHHQSRSAFFEQSVYGNGSQQNLTDFDRPVEGGVLNSGFKSYTCSTGVHHNQNQHPLHAVSGNAAHNVDENGYSEEGCSTCLKLPPISSFLGTNTGASYQSSSSTADSLEPKSSEEDETSADSSGDSPSEEEHPSIMSTPPASATTFTTAVEDIGLLQTATTSSVHSQDQSHDTGTSTDSSEESSMEEGHPNTKPVLPSFDVFLHRPGN